MAALDNWAWTLNLMADQLPALFPSNNLYVEVIFTFDGGAEKTLNMPIQTYKNMKRDIQIMSRPGSEATLVIGLDRGEFVLPWGKVIFYEAFLRGTPDPTAVAEQILGGAAPQEPV